uniref:INSM transcriptional repressor 2 n=1 Tax=Echeneis naucrates TaxID=173247 RepID=A0A665W8N2_ECHNA
MPRGFLVKRNRRCSASYRLRNNNKAVTHDGQRSGGGSARAAGPQAPRESEVLSVFQFERPDGQLLASREDSAGVREAWSPHVESALEAEADRRAQLPESEEQVSEVDVLTPDGHFSSFFPPPPPPRDLTLTEARSPVKPVGTRLLEQQEEGEKQLQISGRCLTSSPASELQELPFLVSSAPTSVSASIERLLESSGRLHAPSYGHADKFDPNVTHVHLFPPLTLMSQEHHAARKHSFLEPDQRLHSNRHHKQSPGNPPKKHKVNRKLNFEDEVTTSPVLGLRIKKESPDLMRQREKSSAAGGNQPLGEFICQLCKEEYPDPFSLAQHKCSRIVRVEYRCPECDKVFSCPANLASHRRWHKPRSVSNQGGETPVNKSQPLKEARGLISHERPEERADQPQQQPPPSLSHPPLPFVQSLPEEEVYECRYCGKKFRRQAYLKKHLAAHEMTAAASPPPPYGQARDSSSGQSQVFLCHLCGARFPSPEIRDNGTGEGEQQQIFTCKHCPSTFFSSPGLTKHINKSHPTENRQVMLLQMTVRP